MNQQNEYPVTNAYLEYAIEEIESVLNDDYGIYHKNVVVLIDEAHNGISVRKLAHFSNIKKITVYNYEDINRPTLQMGCGIDNTLLLQFKRYSGPKESMINRPEHAPYDYISFATNAVETGFNGILIPEIEFKDNKFTFHRPPKSLSICTYESW